MKTSTEVNWPDTATLPFGKYREQPISVLRGDPAYTHFLLTLKWFRNKYPELRAAKSRVNRRCHLGWRWHRATARGAHLYG